MSNSRTGDAGPVWAWNRQNRVVMMLPRPPRAVAPGSHQLLELDQETGSPMICQMLPRQRSAKGVPLGRKRTVAGSSSTCQPQCCDDRYYSPRHTGATPTCHSHI